MFDMRVPPGMDERSRMTIARPVRRVYPKRCAMETGPFDRAQRAMPLLAHRRDDRLSDQALARAALQAFR
jgi:hypothetical protein